MRSIRVEQAFSILRGQDYQINVALRDNSIPTAINLSSNSIAENLAAGSLVANLSASDANPVDQHQFELVAGSGDSDNGLFEVVGGQLRTRQVFDYESRPSFSVRLRVTDATGNAFETSKAISVINLPEVVAVQIGDGTSQRSSVDRVVIELEGQLEIDAGAFSVQKRERDSQGQIVLLTVTTVSTISVLPNGNTSVTLTFDGSYARWSLGALVDGNYQLTIDATKVRVAATQTHLDGDRNGISGGDYILGTQATDRFFCLVR